MAVTDFTGDERAYQIAAHVESYSNHPIANAIVKAYEGEIDKTRVENLQEIFAKESKLHLMVKKFLWDRLKKQVKKVLILQHT